ncbi:hypothetical protein GCM10027343_31260 [Noviherbaspirillum agri]
MGVTVEIRFDDVTVINEMVWGGNTPAALSGVLSAAFLDMSSRAMHVASFDADNAKSLVAGGDRRRST